MPLVKIEMLKGKSSEYKKGVLENVHQSIEEQEAYDQDAGYRAAGSSQFLCRADASGTLRARENTRRLKSFFC